MTAFFDVLSLRNAQAVTVIRPIQDPDHAQRPHGESISIADHLTLGEPDQTKYRPTVRYAYHPHDDAVLSLHEWAGGDGEPPTTRRILRDDITEGHDELGVLLMGRRRNSYWLGSLLIIDAARGLCPDNSATTLQVAAGVLARVVWSMRHPNEGVVEPDDLLFDELLSLCHPCLGEVRGVFSAWHPLARGSGLYNPPIDASHPWQFINFRLT